MTEKSNQVMTRELILSEPEADTIEVVVTGDLCPDAGIEALCLEGQLQDIYGDILDEIKDSDLAITNLECPLTDRSEPIETLGPNLRADARCVDVLSFAGFGVAALANNHIMDQGPAGLADTVAACRRVGIETVGAGVDLAAAMEPLVVDVKGHKVAIVNCAEQEFSTAQPGRPGGAPLNPALNYRQVIKAKEHAEAVIVVLHGGCEHYPLPTPRMAEQYRFLASLGVTAVVGHHTHCPGGSEVYNGVPIFYSLGNFLFDRTHNARPWWQVGYFIKLAIADGKVASVKMVPYRQCDGAAGLRVMGEDETNEFFDKIEYYSRIIGDNDALSAEWQSFCEARHVAYLNSWRPLSMLGKVLARLGVSRRWLLNRGISRPQYMLWLNMLRCQAHRDVSTEMFKQSLGWGQR